jgi:hypothetical protein
MKENCIFSKIHLRTHNKEEVNANTFTMLDSAPEHKYRVYQPVKGTVSGLTLYLNDR